MIRFLQNITGVNVDAQKKASVEMKRGAFVEADEKTGELKLAVALANVTGIVVRDTKVDVEVAMGLNPSEYSDSQDKILVGEYAGHRAIIKGERMATDQYDGTLTDLQAEAGKYLTVTDGKLATSGTATSIISLGWVMDAGHKLLGYKFI